MRASPPLVVLVLGGVAERQDCPATHSPLALAPTPHLDRLAREGRVLRVQLVEDEAQAASAAPHLALLGVDPARAETALASYLGALAGLRLAAEECFVSAAFLSLFREEVADVEPDLRPAEREVLVRDAELAVARAGFRLHAGAPIAVAPRASVDPDTPHPEVMLGASLAGFEPAREQHAFAHRLARQVLDGHEVNEVRRDLGGNGADALWLWGPGGEARVGKPIDARASAIGTDAGWRAVCAAAGLLLRAPQASSPPQLVKAAQNALKRDRVVLLHVRRGVRDAHLRDLRRRTDGVAALDRHIVGPVAKAVAEAEGRLLVLSDTARDTATGRATADPVPALVWGAGITSLRPRPFHEAGAATAGEPLAPGHGLLAYVRHL